MTTADEAVYEKAAADLARMTLPDLSSFPAEQTEIAMVRAFRMNGPDAHWLEEFRHRIDQESAGAIHLDSVDRPPPPPLDKSPAATCKRLVDTVSGAERLLVIGPFNPPFRFVPDRGNSTVSGSGSRWPGT